jgi:hypothetical protein
VIGESASQIIAGGLSELMNELAAFLMPSRFGPFVPDRWDRIRELVANLITALQSFEGWTSDQRRLDELRQILPEFQRLLADPGAPVDQLLARALAEKFLSAAGLDQVVSGGA